MDITNTIAQLKQEPGFTENVGMMLVHNGVVRGWSRGDRKSVSNITVKVDHARVEALRQEYEKKPGIFRVIVETCEGTLKPGDDLLFIVVAGALREDVKPVLAELLDRVKDEAVTKSEAKIG
jgi:molybdopterin synthase catalytic subunit